MKKGKMNLTESEYEVMEILWQSDRPLKKTEIIERSKEKSWKDSYIHRMIRSLLAKKAIKQEGRVLTVKSYAAMFVPAITKEEYSIIQLDNNVNSSITPKGFGGFVASFIGSNESGEQDEFISELEDIVKQMKENK